MTYLKTHDETEIYYEHLNKKSNKKQLIFIHGYLSNWTCFRQQINFFKKEKHPIIFFDLRGHGLSKNPKKEKNNTIEHATQDIKDIMTKTNTKKAIIIGHSFGGLIAMNFSIKNPELTEKLIILDSSHKTPEKLKFLIKIIEHKLTKYIIKKALNKKIRTQKIKNQKEPWDVTKEERKTNPKWFFIKSMLRSNPDTVCYFAEEALTKKLTNLHKITSPTLIIEHNSDEFYTKQEITETAKKIKNHQLKFYEGKHDSIIRNPNELIQEIKKFINKETNETFKIKNTPPKKHAKVV